MNRSGKGLAVAKGAKRKTDVVAITRWLQGYRSRRALLFCLGSVGTLLLSVPILFVSWWVIWAVFFVPFVILAHAPLKVLSIATWVSFGSLFVAHLTRIRKHLESLKVDEETPGMVAAQFAAHVAGMSSLALFMVGPNTMQSQVKVFVLVLLTGPAMLGLSLRLIRAAIAVGRLDVEYVGQALAELIDAGRRVSVDDLARTVGCPHPPQLLRELLLVDGVVLLTSGDPSLTLTDSLRTEVSSGIERFREA